MALGALPNELLLLLFSLLRQKDACRLSQASRIWHQRVEEHLPERQHAWRHGVALLSWAERAVKRVRHRRQQSRQRVSMVMHSFVPVHAPAQAAANGQLQCTRACLLYAPLSRPLLLHS